MTAWTSCLLAHLGRCLEVIIDAMQLERLQLSTVLAFTTPVRDFAKAGLQALLEVNGQRGSTRNLNLVIWEPRLSLAGGTCTVFRGRFRGF